ncbi:hypothetical protein [Streptomyces virginiae]|uniref:hypothetical protein n=1 Tax=Streptomyces virginiae TaxID=1961 RepID=UPI00224DFBC2|nr:hypothetical protein [Streptomyces virginiae]MCX5174028.1 PEX11 family protein [Streptomyces virginiae]
MPLPLALEGFEGQPAGGGGRDCELAVEDQVLGQLLGNGDQAGFAGVISAVAGLYGTWRMRR